MKPQTARSLAIFSAAVFALFGCTQLAEGPVAERGEFPSLYSVPERPPPGPTAAEAQAMIAELQTTRTEPASAIPAQPPRPPERRAAAPRPAAPAESPAAMALRTWVATVIPAADGGLGPEDRARLGVIGGQPREGGRLLLEMFGLSVDDPAAAAIRAALVESGWPTSRIRQTILPQATGIAPKVDIFIEY